MNSISLAEVRRALTMAGDDLGGMSREELDMPGTVQ